METITERSLTGMTDKQFQSYQKGLLRQLERAMKRETIEEREEEIKEVISDLKDALSRP